MPSITAEPNHGHTVDSHSHTIAAEAPGTGDEDSATVVDQNLDGITTNVASGPPAGGHGHTVNSHSHGGSSGTSSPTTDGAGGHDHGGATGGATGNTGASNPPYLVLQYIVCTGVA